MAKSLSEQLLGAGLVDQKKAKQAQQEKRKETRAQHKRKQPPVDQTQVRLAQERAAKAEQDRALNQQRREAENLKAMRAQVRQMLDHSGVKPDGDIRFNFNDPRNNRIKSLLVSARQQNQLAQGQLAVCSDSDRFVLVPRNIADKIAQRFQDAVIFLADYKNDTLSEDDPYKDFPIPDDLMW
ncbi:MAG: nucleoprotein/polynucleotide-associated enzyme [Gammaproteobacteria bacterium]|nr:nucleoprotein/polynucleotide-associated enzyme [Gammaproteobacteria bacterium]|tara:strand:- start:290 stop:835 length:546 start_codon:yes stop_codon:yes gene_type:complete